MYENSKSFTSAIQHRAFLSASAARLAGAVTNAVGGILLGFDANNNEVWASMVSGQSDKFLCDSPHRAFVQAVVIKDQRAIASARAVVLEGIQSLDVVADWHAGVQGSDLAERYAFAYDALVSEAEGSTG